MTSCHEYYSPLYEEANPISSLTAPCLSVNAPKAGFRGAAGQKLSLWLTSGTTRLSLRVFDSTATNDSKGSIATVSQHRLHSATPGILPASKMLSEKQLAVPVSSYSWTTILYIFCAIIVTLYLLAVGKLTIVGPTTLIALTDYPSVLRQDLLLGIEKNHASRTCSSRTVHSGVNSVFSSENQTCFAIFCATKITTTCSSKAASASESGIHHHIFWKEMSSG